MNRAALSRDSKRRIKPLWQLKAHFYMPSVEAPFPFGGGFGRSESVDSVAPKSGTGATANRPAPDTRKVGS